MKLGSLSIVFILSVFFLPVMSSADLKPDYFFADGNGKAWEIEEGSYKKPDIGIDEDGQAWAICNGRLYRANPELLKEIISVETTEMRPLFFTKSPQGQLYLLWTGHCGLKVTAISKGKIEKVASLQKNVNKQWNVFFCVDRAGRIWISGNFPIIYCWEDGQWKEHKLKRDMFDPSEYEREIWPKCLSWRIECAEAASGKMFFWGGGLEGLLIFSEGKLEYFRKPFSLTLGRFWEMKAAANGVFWVTTDIRKPQLFEVDIEKKKWTLPIPPNHPLRNQETLYVFPQKQGEKFILCRTENNNKHSLWRIANDEIRCEIENVGQTFILYGGNPSSLLVSKKGHIWLSAFHLGVWLKLKGADKWEHLDYSFGFPISAANNIKEDKDGNIWFSGYHSNGLVCLSSPVKTVKKWLNRTHSQNWKRFGRIWRIFDSNGRLWATLSGKSYVFGRFAWNGWTIFTPSKQPKHNNNTLCRDDKGAVWLVDIREDGEGRELVVFENEKDVYFPNMESTCESLAKKGEVRNVYEERYSSYGDVRNVICSIKNEKACFSRHGLLYYFNGRDWKHWQIQDIDAISGKMKFDRASNQPFFDTKNNLCVNIRERTWLWNGEQWKAVAFIQGQYEKMKQLNTLKRGGKKA